MQEWITPAATLVASFAGALVAFCLQAWNASRGTRAKNVAAINRVLMTLLLHGRVMSNYKASMLGQYDESDPLRAVKVDASLEYDLALYRYDFKSLDFFASIAERKVVLQLYEEQSLFIETLQSINDRSSLVYNEVDPALLKAGLADGGDHDGPRYPKALGPALFNALERKTDALAQGVDETVEKIDSTVSSFGDIAHAHYPKERIMELNIDHPAPAP